MLRRKFLAASLASFAAARLPLAAQHPRAAELADDDPLASWRDGAAKRAILDFVACTTNPNCRDFVPVAHRVAVFDNDGTLWPENPLPFELAFAFDRARAALARNPQLAERPAFKALAENDVAALAADHYRGLFELLIATHTGETVESFDKAVADWFESARHPRYGKRYDELAYQPMLEVLAYLRRHEFKTFIVSGGGAAFMRVWCERVYGIPPEQVVGTLFKTQYALKDDKPQLAILPEVAFIDDKGGKPVGIYQMIGRRPIACFGNSDGDQAMLEWTTIGRSPSLGVLVHHTDAQREYAYDEKPRSSGKLVEALRAAPQRNWTVVDMQRDWKRCFAFESL
ncbi:MAG: HAD family hydrolase [Pirellulales bacterium]